jgi:hypothetical protein
MLRAAKLIGQLGRELIAIGDEFPPSEHVAFNVLLGSPATAEEFCLPALDRARVVFAKNLNAIRRDAPALSREIDDLLARFTVRVLTDESPPAGP